jgi:hypothetical protein
MDVPLEQKNLSQIIMELDGPLVVELIIILFEQHKQNGKTMLSLII